jgi:hypothetical protein
MPASPGGGLRRSIAIGQQSHVFRARPRQEIQRCQRDDDERRHREARDAPPVFGDQPLHPRQEHDRAHARAREGDTDRQTAPAHEPVRQEERVPRVAQTHGAAGDQHAERQVEMPRRGHERRQPEPGADHRDAEQHDRARPAPIDQPAEDRAEDPRHQEAEREGAGGEPARPAELVKNRREQQREHGARVDADAHRDEGDGDDDPAVEDRGDGWRCGGRAHASQVILLYDPLAVRAADRRGAAVQAAGPARGLGPPGPRRAIGALMIPGGRSCWATSSS